MKNSPFTTMLLGATAILVVAALVLCWLYGRRVTELRNTQAAVQQLQIRQQGVPMLVNDLVAYSETHKDIVPILEQHGITNRSAAKPAGK